MRPIGLLFLLALSVPSVYASPCVSASLASYVALGAGGCGVGPFTVKDFSYSVVSANVAISGSDIMVTPVFGPDSFALLFSSTSWNISGSQFAHHLLAYTWDPGSIRSLEDILNTSTPVAPGVAKITTDACRDAAFVGNLCSTTVDSILVSHNGITPNLVAAVNYSPPIGTIGIRNLIELDANGASSQFDSFSNTVFVPEPGSWLLVLVGLLWVAGRRLGVRLSRRLRPRVISA